MDITQENLEFTFKGFQTVFNEAFAAADNARETLAMVVKSSTSEENYAWLGQFPHLREWIGDRVVKKLAAHGFKITNRIFESTVTVNRTDLEDDRVGIYRPMLQEMGRVSATHPNELIFPFLANGFVGAGYDGEAFFSDKHPMDGVPLPPLESPLAPEKVVSNMQDGSGAGWYLLDLSRAIRPIIWQERIGYELQSVTDPKSDFVFRTDKFLYGVRARVNAGYGLWQLAFGSKDTLGDDNYTAARSAMMGFAGDEGQLLGIAPTHLVVGRSNERAARALLNSDTIDGTSNVWKGSAQLIVSPYLA